MCWYVSIVNYAGKIDDLLPVRTSVLPILSGPSSSIGQSQGILLGFCWPVLSMPLEPPSDWVLLGLLGSERLGDAGYVVLLGTSSTSTKLTGAGRHHGAAAKGKTFVT